MAASILYGVATYFYYEKVRRTKRTAIVSNLLKVWAIWQQFASSSQMKIILNKVIRRFMWQSGVVVILLHNVIQNLPEILLTEVYDDENHH